MVKSSCSVVYFSYLILWMASANDNQDDASFDRISMPKHKPRPFMKRHFSSDEGNRSLSGECQDSDPVNESPIRFAYLITGEDESTFSLTSLMLGPNSDVYQCMWGEPKLPPSTLRCSDECTGDYKQVCRRVCRDPSTPAFQIDGEGQLRTLYVRGSSFNQGRNHLYDEARRISGGQYLYYILIVDDLELYNGLS
jgi:hypothetical protein